MRRFFLLIMIALLPLRGWVGDVMAMEMLVQHPIAMQNIANSADKESASGQFDAEMQAECPGHAEPATPVSGTDKNHCGSCPLCQICHSVAAPAPWSAQPSGWLSHALPDVAHTRFASAPAAFALKPPIS